MKDISESDAQILEPYYTFSNINLLQQALTHSSWANEHKVKDNERLEFLGDAILQLLATEALFQSKEIYNEGKMTAIRQLTVREESLAAAAEDLGLGKALLLGQGEERTGGREKTSNLADAFEAILAAIYLDAKAQDHCGLDAARKFFYSCLGPTLEAAKEGKLIYDYKSKLLEWVQSLEEPAPLEFRVLSQEGPAHHPIFHMAAYIGEQKVAKVKAASKQAEQN